jgi:hypothetical protein
LILKMESKWLKNKARKIIIINKKEAEDLSNKN